MLLGQNLHWVKAGRDITLRMEKGWALDPIDFYLLGHKFSQNPHYRKTAFVKYFTLNKFLAIHSYMESQECTYAFPFD